MRDRYTARFPHRTSRRRHAGLLGAAMLALVLNPGPVAADIVSYAIIRDDATLKVQGQIIRLFGVDVVATDRGCLTVIRPVRCASRAVRALEVAIQGFVRCEPQVRYDDGSLGAFCFVDRRNSILDPPLDLGAFLIEEGLAVATADAPPRYATLERIARARERGIWGFQVDAIR